jgi:patatin-related protein
VFPMSNYEREFRLALGMRGGVSLAVWIGGACAEIDELRRAPTDGGALTWRSLAGATGYSRVIVDVMAGASAGGLNGVLFAACQVYGVPFSSIRETWLDVGSTQQLVRTDATERTSGTGTGPATPADLRWLSLFRGDGHMYHQIDVQLNDLISNVPRTSRPSKAPHIDLRLAATHVEPILRAVRSPSDERLFERRYSTEFRFSSPALPWLESDFPPYAVSPEIERDRFEGHVSRLALAARATSSYPGAFEAASIRSTRSVRISDPRPRLISGVGVEMAGIFADRARAHGSAERTDSAQFVVADGGIVDNIPLRRAFDAVAAAPAESPTDRYLVYLHPGAPSVATEAASDTLTEQRRRSIISVLRAAVGARVRSEDISGDIAVIDEHNHAVDRAAAARRANFAGLQNRDDLLSFAASVRESYRAQRADEDRRLIAGLLDDPIHFLGEDPFPAVVGDRNVPDASWRSPLQEFSAQQRRALTTAIDERMSSRTLWSASGLPDGELFVTGARPLIRVTQTLIEWARTVEANASSQAGSLEAGQAKQALYRVLTFCEECIERPRRLAWVALVATAPQADSVATIDETLRRLRGLTVCTDNEAQKAAAALNDGTTDVLRALVAESLARVDVVVKPPWSPLPTSQPAGATEPTLDMRREIAERVLAQLAEQLRSVQVDVADPSAVASPGALLQRVLSDGGTIDVETLAALEIACYSEYATGLPGRRPIEFVRLSAANPTPLAPHFTALEDDASRNGGRWWDQTQRCWNQQAGIHVELKLAGNELSNFSAFLREEWRANDWMWGRMDAVPTLVDLMVTPSSLRRTGRSTDELVADIGSIVMADGPDDLTELGAQLWADHNETIQAELAALTGTSNNEPVPLTATRRAIVARRQWEILVEELPGAGSVQDRIATYRVGAETISDPIIRNEIRDRLKEIVYAASRTAVANAYANGVTRWGSARRPSLRGRGTQITIRIGGWFGIRKLLKQK